MQPDMITNNTYEATVIEEYSFTDLLQMKINPFLLSLEVSDRTKKAYVTNINYFVDWVKDSGMVIKTRDNIIAYRTWLISKKLKATTINAYLTAVRRFFGWLYEHDLIDKDFAKSVKSIQVDAEHKKDPISEDQWIELMGGIDFAKLIDRRDYMIMVLGANYGLRSIEIIRLNKEDIVMVQGQWALMLWRKGYEEADKKPRPIMADHAEMLLTLVGDGTAIFKSMSNNDCSIQSERLSTSGLRYAMRKRFREASIESDRISFHSLRHFFATSLIKNDVPLLQVRDALDHKSVTTTEIYVATASRFDNPVAFGLNLATPTSIN